MGSLTAGGGWKMGEKAYLTALEDSAPTSTHDEIQSRANLGKSGSNRPAHFLSPSAPSVPLRQRTQPVLFCKRRQVG
jgi:hypothetical protein